MQFIKKFKNFSFAILVTGFALSLMSVFNGCDENTVTPPTTSKSRTTITHASPNAPNVDILVGDNVIATNVAYPSTLPYTELNTGNNRIRIRPTGTTTAVIDETLFFEESKSYSIFAIDSVSKISALFLTDDLTAPGSGNAKVRFIHLSPNAPAVDVAVTGGSNLFPNYAFKEFSSFRAVGAGTYNLEVRLANQPVVVLSLPNITFESGKIYTIYARGFVGASGTQALGAGIINNN